MKRRRDRVQQAEAATGRRGNKLVHLPVAISPRRPFSPSNSLPVPAITLLSDFGTADYFVAAMKGVILSVNPEVRVVDITHEIPPQDIEAAAFTLFAAHVSFPGGTIHVAVVDPGVGSGRRSILLQAGNQFFIGPDNGIFSYIYDYEPGYRVFHLTNEKYFRQPVSATFQGRDIFAPVAAVLSLGVSPSELGAGISDPTRLETLRPGRLKNGKLKARVIHIDRFGNCITNLTRNELTEEMIQRGARLEIGNKTIKSFRRFFAEQRSGDKLFALWGSAGFLEIAAENNSAAKILRARRGQAVLVSD